MRRLLVLSIVAASVTVGATTASAATWIRQAPAAHAGKHTLVAPAHGKAAPSATWIRAAKLGKATWIR